ncbi:hypothetical protein C1645_769007 [Glomus cerebriforme]|uniref:Uncharacterized protein n=1 Tax=Glomus cerebriforme TaxID=658196 RepID=A0A397T1P9_9GLOM|nr:hypothetical protein C1645_769007 [Glomus cerebriforme]
MAQRTLPRDSENREYRGLFYKERYSETNKEDSSKHQGRETLRDLTYKNTGRTTTIKKNDKKIDHKPFRERIFGKDLLLLSSTKDEQIENCVQSTLDTNKFFTDLSKEKTSIYNKNDILKRTYFKVEIENHFEKIYGKNGIKGMVIDFYDLEFIKNTKLSVPEWLLRDNSEKLFEAELPPQDITVFNLWFFRRKIEGAPDFVQKGIKPISNADISSHLEKIYNSREEKRSDTNGTNKSGSKMIRLVLDELRKVNNYMLYIGCETRYPNNVTEKTPKLIEKLEKVLEKIRTCKNYEENKSSLTNMIDEKAIKYAKELLDVAWMNFNVRTIDISKNRVIFRKVWIEVNKELEEILQ